MLRLPFFGCIAPKFWFRFLSPVVKGVAGRTSRTAEANGTETAQHRHLVQRIRMEAGVEEARGVRVIVPGGPS